MTMRRSASGLPGARRACCPSIQRRRSSRTPLRILPQEVIGRAAETWPRARELFRERAVFRLSPGVHSAPLLRLLPSLVPPTTGQNSSVIAADFRFIRRAVDSCGAGRPRSGSGTVPLSTLLPLPTSRVRRGHRPAHFQRWPPLDRSARATAFCCCTAFHGLTAVRSSISPLSHHSQRLKSPCPL